MHLVHTRMAMPKHQQQPAAATSGSGKQSSKRRSIKQRPSSTIVQEQQAEGEQQRQVAATQQQQTAAAPAVHRESSSSRCRRARAGMQGRGKGMMQGLRARVWAARSVAGIGRGGRARGASSGHGGRARERPQRQQSEAGGEERGDAHCGRRGLGQWARRRSGRSDEGEDEVAAVRR